MSVCAAIVLGGGRSARMGTDKLALEIDGATLLARTCEAAAAVTERIVVAGHEQPGLAVEFVLEDPPFGGPVAGIVAAIQLLTQQGVTGLASADEVLLLAGDLANPVAAVSVLMASDLGSDGVVLLDDEGWHQYLAGRYRMAALVQSVAQLDTDRDVSVRRLLRGLDVAVVPAPSSVTADLDTPEQFAQVAQAATTRRKA